MTDHTQRSAEEARTHELFSEESYKALGLEWSPSLAMVAMVFRARWHAALTIEQINATAKVLGDLQSEPDLQELVTKLARKKVLRGYRKQGRYLYEVNY
jgi:hypothetical protein